MKISSAKEMVFWGRDGCIHVSQYCVLKIDTVNNRYGLIEDSTGSSCGGDAILGIDG